MTKTKDAWDMTEAERTAEAARNRAEAERRSEASRESFDRCDTDGFLSQWASDMTASKLRAEAKLVEAGGLAEFPGLFDVTTGERVPAVLVVSDGKWGRRYSWRICDPKDGRGLYKWVNSRGVNAGKRAKANMEREGYVERMELARARVRIMGSGTGLSGAASCYVGTERVDGGYPGRPGY